MASLRLITLDSDGSRRLALKLYDPDYNDVWILSDYTADWSSPVIIRIEKDEDYLTVMTAPAVASPSFTQQISTEVFRLPAWSGMYTSRVAFGILDLKGQDVISTREFVRYAFHDARFQYTTDYRIGFEQIQHPGETDFYRSPKILINDNGEADPSTGTNQVKASIRRDLPADFNGLSVPVKVRLSLADWDDPDPALPAGFFPGGFPAYDNHTPLNTTRSALVVNTASNSPVTSGSLQWDFTVDQARMARRLFLAAAADVPLLPTPWMIPGSTMAVNLVNDTDPVENKIDLRCALRQFLPDYYVRDRDTDDGSVPSAGGGGRVPTSSWGYSTISATPMPPMIQMIFPIRTLHRLPIFPGIPPVLPGVSTPQPSTSGTYKEIDDQKGGILKITTNAWIDFGGNDYFNRVWVRLSNRGVVPGPAKVQVFYGDAELRSDFVLSETRDNDWEHIYGKIDGSVSEPYVQDRFVRFGPKAGDDTYPMEVVDAIPALSGFSSVDAGNPGYTLADFKWGIPSGSWTELTAGNKTHGCLTAIINHPDWSIVDNDMVDIAKRWDGGSLDGGSVWPMTSQSNNITVRNTNIVQITDPGTSGNENFNQNLKSAIGPDNDPVNYRKSPVNYNMTFGAGEADWGLRLDGRKFPDGELIIRLPRNLSSSVKLRNFSEVTEYTGGKKVSLKPVISITPSSIVKPPAFIDLLGPYRFFQLKRGTVGELRSITPGHFGKRTRGAAAQACQLYMRPDAGIKPGI